MVAFLSIPARRSVWGIRNARESPLGCADWVIGVEITKVVERVGPGSGLTCAHFVRTLLFHHSEDTTMTLQTSPSSKWDKRNAPIRRQRNRIVSFLAIALLGTGIGLSQANTLGVFTNGERRTDTAGRHSTLRFGERSPFSSHFSSALRDESQAPGTWEMVWTQGQDFKFDIASKESIITVSASVAPRNIEKNGGST